MIDPSKNVVICSKEKKVIFVSALGGKQRRKVESLGQKTISNSPKIIKWWINRIVNKPID